MRGSVPGIECWRAGVEVVDGMVVSYFPTVRSDLGRGDFATSDPNPPYPPFRITLARSASLLSLYHILS
jgi:hypothetical protein